MSRDDGFSIIEAIMASFVVVLLFAGFGKSMGAAFAGSRENVVAQEATALAVEQLEFIRSFEWDEIAMPHLVSGVPYIDAQASVLLGDEVGLSEDEPLRVNPQGLVYPESIEIVDGTAYAVYRYVTDTSDGLRRVVILITWEVEGVVSSHRTSTLVSEVSTR